ncbi:curli assembly protein CsgF [Labilibaculum sp. K2S]|uniref:curli production assembly/transport component CsgF n=1 Tax=Labilibaculum sp. K2S TaxID=3056386 RepID=UPI0025A31B13|nr:curli production assembly/transport component CsgF [Labilibaculum sp. K2S]MDM8158237.1 curli assembly protein CsgF [Labilibaculum sp. K2S]
MNIIKIVFVLSFLSLLLPTESMAQDFVYKPINSSFGGDQYNYNWLLNSATQQNRIEDPNADSALNKDPLNDFQDNLNRQILNQLSSKLVNSIFGDNNQLETGSYNLGNYKVDISEDASGVTVNVSDITNGNFTNIVIPSY